MTTDIEIRKVADLATIAEAWERLRKRETTFFPAFDDLQACLRSREGCFLVLGRVESDEIVTLCCVLVERTHKRYTIGERKLFILPIREARFFGSARIREK